MKNIILFLVFAVLLGALTFAWYLGALNRMKVEDTQAGGFMVAGLDLTGPYAEAGKTMTEIETKLNGIGIKPAKGFGLYYDDPKIVPAEKCRSFVGSILEEKDLDKITQLKSLGLRIDSVSRTQAVVTEFPLKSTLSYMIGPLKAYPAISKYLAEKNYTVKVSLEVYDMKNEHILYILQYEK